MMRIALALAFAFPALALAQPAGKPVPDNVVKRVEAKVARALTKKPDAPAGPRLTGDIPKRVNNVSVDVEDDEVGNALRQIAEQAGWDLVIRAPSRMIERDVTMHLKNRPANTATELVLDLSGLTATLRDGVLVVSAGDYAGAALPPVPPTPPTPPVGPRHHKGHSLVMNDDADEDADENDDEDDMRVHVHGGANDRVVVGSDLNIGAEETVDSAVAVGGSVSVAGHVRQDVVAVGGDVSLSPGAMVEGDAVAVGGEVSVPEGAMVHGDQVGLGGSLGGLISGIVGIAMSHSGASGLLFGILSSLLRGLALLVIATLLLSFMPERIEAVRTALAERTGHSTLAGAALLVGFAPLCLLLIVTVVGIPLVPLALFILLAMLLVGMTALCTWLGYRIPLFEAKKTPIIAMLIGLVVVMLIDLIPFFGTLVLTCAAFIAAGAVLLTRFGGKRPQTQAIVQAEMS